MFPFSDNVPRLRPPIVTYLLIIANVWVFMIGLKLPQPSRNELSFKHGFVPVRLQQLVNPQPIEITYTERMVLKRERRVIEREVPVILPADRKAVVLSLLTYMFMHGSWLHLIGNMWMLWIFGDNVEDRLGHAGYLVFYTLGGIVAALGHWLNQIDSTVPIIGASGAIAAVLGAYAVTWPWARVKTLVFIVIFITVVDLPALVVHGIWFLTQLLHAREAALSGEAGGIAWWAHIVGFLFGAVVMPLVRSDEPEEIDEDVDPHVIDVHPVGR